MSLKAQLHTARRTIILRAVKAAKGNLVHAARALEVHRNTLGRLCAEHGIRVARKDKVTAATRARITAGLLAYNARKREGLTPKWGSGTWSRDKKF